MTASVPEESNSDAARRQSEVFPRSGRLLRHADFERVYKLGRRHLSPSMTVFYLPRPEAARDRRASGGNRQKGESSRLRIGFTVGRAFGGAVQRNRMKRRLREAVRLARPWACASADVVIHPKKMLLTAEFSGLMNELRQAFVVIEQKLAGKPGAQEAACGSRKLEGKGR